MNRVELDRLCVNTIRFLSVDMVQNANSGHPGLPLDAAPMAYVLWTRFLRHNPKQSDSHSPRATSHSMCQGAAAKPARAMEP